MINLKNFPGEGAGFGDELGVSIAIPMTTLCLVFLYNEGITLF